MYTPQHLFGEIQSSSEILTHEPFLERARVQREQADDGSARLALGAYVVARLIDKLLSPASDPAASDGFRWQLEAVRRHVGDLPPDAPETAHLAGVVGAVQVSGPIEASLWKNLIAYAYFLEHEARLEESLEILTLAVRVQGDQISPAEFTAYALFSARLNRQLARWAAANNCYAAAEESAGSSGDFVSMLRGRLGRGMVHRGQGNFPAARDILDNVLRAGAELRLPEVLSLAYGEAGVLYGLQGLRLESLEAHYRAFQLIEDPVERMRCLGDLALGLFEIGAYDVARVALEIVARSQARVLVRINAALELMSLEASVGNRVAFERWRAKVQEQRDFMSPSMTVDYNYKLGTGLARFGQLKRAQIFLATALRLAEQHKLNAWYFKIEEAIGTLAETAESPAAPSPASILEDAAPLREIEMGLREYASTEAHQ